jgi:DNA-binding beta-propeller fold protein YncE
MRPILVLACALGLSAGAGGQTILSSFPVAPATTSFLGGLEFDCNSGIVWIADETNNLMSAYDSSGRFLKSYPAVLPPGATVTDPQPIGVGINPTTGMLWIGDEAERVFELDPKTNVPTGVSWSTTPGITDVSGLAVDPLTGNIYVSQDSAPRKIVEFTPTGTLVTTITLPTTGSSTDPDGLAYDALNNVFYVGDDTANAVYRVDATGATVATFNLSALNVSPEGLGIDPVNGILYVGDGFVTRRVYAMGGIVPPGGPCLPGPSLFYISVTTTGAGDATVVLNNVPPGATEGWTFFTLDVALPVGAGPIFGATTDANTLSIFSLAPVAIPGFVLHWTWPVAGLFPAVPFVLPPGSMTPFAGQTWDLIGIAVAGPTIIPTFNVSRVTW